jgi:hypothetical protein
MFFGPNGALVFLYVRDAQALMRQQGEHDAGYLPTNN